MPLYSVGKTRIRGADMKQAAVLLVDLDAAFARRLRDAFVAAGHEVFRAEGVRDSLERLRTHPISVLVARPEVLAGPGLDLASRATRLRPQVVLVAGEDLEPADREATFRAGIFDVVSPTSEEALEPFVARVTVQAGRLAELQRLRDSARARSGIGGLVGRSDLLRRAREDIVRYAASDVPVLLVGEAGTGREHGARFLHATSRRASGPFLVVDGRGGGLGDGEAGSTRLRGATDGPWERAEGGTLFLRDLCEWLPDAQDRLTVALATTPTTLGPRVVAACGLDPDEAARIGRLPVSLRAAFSDAVVALPPLRERVEDVPFLAQHFLEAICEMNELAELRLSRDATEILTAYGWPGNVRELRAAVEQAALVSEGGVIRPRDLPEAIRRSHVPALHRGGAAETGFREAKRDVVDRFEREYLDGLLERHAGNVTEAATAAGMMRSALQRLLRKHRIRSSAFRSRGARTGGPDL